MIRVYSVKRKEPKNTFNDGWDCLTDHELRNGLKDDVVEVRYVVERGEDKEELARQEKIDSFRENYSHIKGKYYSL